MKYTKTKYPNIFSYEIKSGKRYVIRRGYFFEGTKKEFNKSGFKTIAEAKNALTQFELDLQANSTLKLIGQKMTINEFWDKFSESKIKTGQWSADSETTYTTIYNNVLMPKWGDTKLINLSRQDFENWSVEQLKMYSRSSVRSHYILLKAVINDAIYNGYIDRNPIQRIHIGKSTKKERNTNMTLSDYSKWMNTAERILTSYEFTMVYLTIFGLRRGEVMGLKSSSIKLLKNNKVELTISDSRTVGNPKGKGTTKTGRTRVDVLDEKGSKLLLDAVSTVKDIKALKNQVLHQDDYLFVNPATAKPYHVTKLNKLFLDVNKVSKIHAFPHMMRHFFATQAIAAGVSIEHVAEYLGHSTTYMTEKYKEVTNEVASQVIDLYEKRISKAK